MAKHIFEGTAKWAKVYKPDEKYGNYTINVYLDDASLKRYIEAGCRGRINSDEDGQYVTFRMNQNSTDWEGKPLGAPKVVDADNVTFTDLIGNGSKVRIQADVYNSKNGVATRLEAVKVLEHVIYEGREEEAF